MNSRSEMGARLEGIIDRVATSYQQDRPIDCLESTALPNERKIIEALKHLEHVMYMGFYSSRELNAVNLRQHIGQHMHEAFEGLVEHIARALAYNRNKGGSPDDVDRVRAEQVVLKVFDCIPTLREDMAKDIEAAYQGDPAAKGIEEIIFSYPSVRALTIHRLAHELYLEKIPMVPRIMSEHAHGQTGIEIHPGASIGERFFIDHGTGVVIGETAKIGERVKIYQGVTLGALSMPRTADGELIREARRHPTIEDDVTIYAGTTILGGETVIGARSVIGANVWLTESVPPDTRVTYSAEGGAQKVSTRPSLPPPPVDEDTD